MSERLPLSIVIPTKDRADKLDRCLDALGQVVTEQDEVLVVDSASRDDETRRSAERHGVGYLRADRPGTSRARNVGWRAARHDHVAFIDDDVLVTSEWPDAIAAAFTDPEVAFVAGRIELPPDHDETNPALSLFTDPDPHVVDKGTRGLLGISANTAVRRDALRSINGFDTRLGPATWFGGGEDNDFFDRLVRAGFVGRYEPCACVWHVQWRSGSAYLSVQWSYGKGMGARFAKALLRDRRRAFALLPEVTRIGGVRTAVSDVRHRTKRSWAPAIVWRLGVVAGFFVGVVRLRGEHTG